MAQQQVQQQPAPDSPVAIVTGASRGIGRAIAQRLVADGVRVCLTARSAGPLEQVVDALGGAEHAIGVAGKAHDPAHQQDAVDATIAAFGRVDHLVNNVGTSPVYGPLLELDLGAARKMVDINVLAMLSWTRLVHRAWMGEHGGSVVNVSSVAGLRPAGPISFYGATKAMVSYLTAALAVELGPRIRVNAVAPAVVKTVFAAALYEGHEEDVSATYPLGRLGVPQDVAGAVTFLLGEDSAWVTGQTLVLDGGLLQQGGI